MKKIWNVLIICLVALLIFSIVVIAEFYRELNIISQKTEKPIQQISEETTTVRINYNNLKIFKKDFQYNSNTNWEIGVIIISVLIIGWTRLFFRNIISNFVNAALSYQTSFNLFIDSNILTKRVSSLLDALFYINVSFFLFKLL